MRASSINVLLRPIVIAPSLCACTPSGLMTKPGSIALMHLVHPNFLVGLPTPRRLVRTHGAGINATGNPPRAARRSGRGPPAFSATAFSTTLNAPLSSVLPRWLKAELQRVALGRMGQLIHKALYRKCVRQQSQATPPTVRTGNFSTRAMVRRLGVRHSECAHRATRQSPRRTSPSCRQAKTGRPLRRWIADGLSASI